MSRIYWMFFILIQISSNSIVKKLHIAHAAPMQASRVPFSINPYIRHWEPAHFDRDVLGDANEKHKLSRRRKRDINYNNQSPHYGAKNTIEFTIKGHERNFHVKLREDPTSIFAPDLVIENSNGPIDFDVSRIYTGSLKDDENSHVYGVLTSDNLFDGTITTRTEQFYIEPSHKYSKTLAENGVHSIIYKLSDVRLNAHNHNHADPLTNSTDHHLHCSSEKLHRRTKRFLLQQDEKHEPPIPLDLETPYNTRINVNDDYQSDQASPNTNVNRNILINSYNPNSDYNLRNIITKTNHNVLTNVFNGSNHPNRINNNFTATNQMNVNSRPNHKTHVEIITKNGPTKKPSNVIVNNYNPDLIYANNNPPNKYYPNNQFPHLYHPQHHVNLNNFDMMNLKPATSGSPADRKSTCMLYLQADHTFFQKLGSDEASIESITRHVQRANMIYKNTDFNGDGKPDNITFMIKRIKVHNTNALKDPSYRFPGNYGVEKFLELFSEENYDQFCLAYMFTYRDFEMGTLGLAWTGDLKNAGGVCEKNGHYRGSLKSLNTGIVTLLNYGKHVPPAVSHVTLAHEIGHNFGSPHDPDQCTPGGEDGNFIMFARATSGDKRNNNKFSPCSLKSIEPVLNTKARSSKGCFTEPQPAICGNGVVEEGEECDCGWEEDCNDVCCNAMSAGNSAPCTLKPNARCSPSQGPCCQADCTLNYGAKCRDDNGCRDPSYCNGGSAQCPPSKNKANKTICNRDLVCFMGECTGSICLAYGLESCQCIAGEGDAKTKSCELCCKLPGENQPCKSSFEWNTAPYDVPDMYSKPGTPCNDYNGYCDVFQRCREVDPSGPLATLRKLLLSEESIASFKKWVIHNWYAVSLIIVGVFALLILSTRYLGKKSNLKLKTVTIIHSATTETVRLPDDNNGVIVHTAVRTKVPLKKKVRGERKKNNQQSSSTPKDTVVTANATQIVKPARLKKVQESPRKLLRKKKRHPSSGAVDNVVKKEEPPKAQRRLKKKNSQAKEVIDYSSPEQHTNTFGKVQKWLLESPIVLSAASQFEHSSKSSTTVINKSQSSPEHLAANLQSQSPQQPQRAVNIVGGKSKNKSISHVNNKVRLQVVFKPPFKFSLKLSKNDNGNVKTTVASGGNRKRDSRKRNSLEDPLKSQSRRAALLIRSATEDISSKQVDQEPMYETLTKVSSSHRQKSSTLPSSSGGAANEYENLPTTSSTANLIDATLNNATTSPIINTATFRINKSSRNLPVIATPVLSKSQKTSQSSHRGSQQNLNRERRPSVSSSNLIKFGGSSQNLTRSSTTNLTKSSGKHEQSIKRRASDMNRSSTTNLNKYHRQQSQNSSNSNLRRDASNLDIVCSPDDTIVNERKSHSRKNSVNLSKSNSNLAIAGNTSHSHPMPGSSRREESFKNNIPRASLINASTIVNAISNNPFKRQTSFNVNAKPTPLSHQSRLMLDELNKNRPQTSSCDSSMFKNFEWPKVLTTQRSLPAENAALQSDMEVMLSDGENVANDS